MEGKWRRSNQSSSRSRPALVFFDHVRIRSSSWLRAFLLDPACCSSCRRYELNKPFFWLFRISGIIGALCYLFVISTHWPEEEEEAENEEEYQKVSDGVSYFKNCNNYFIFQGPIINEENINVEMIRTTSEIQRQEFY